jgi:putative CRISPR-associated protein (TIGR02619 family)
MKKVITMVGTSLFENFFDEDRNDVVFTYYTDLKEKRASEWESESSRIKKLNDAVRNRISSLSETEKFEVSAEVKSLQKLKEELKGEFEIYLLSSDTVLSRLAGEIIKDEVEKLEIGTAELHSIPGLQIWDRDEFKRGMAELIQKIYAIANYYWEDVIINITGGFKATIPFLTILAQVNRYPIYYIFEDTNTLIKIPWLAPLDINWELFKNYEGIFKRLEREDIVLSNELFENKSIEEQFLQEAGSLLEIEKEQNKYLIALNNLGYILWEKYKERYDLFYISPLVAKYIKEKEKNLKAINKTLKELKRRLIENPDHPDLHHGLKNVDLPKGFNVFKHKEEDLQVRVLYKYEEFSKQGWGKEIEIFVCLIAIGKEVHNAENEYVKLFENKANEIQNLENYQIYKLWKED